MAAPLPTGAPPPSQSFGAPVPPPYVAPAPLPSVAPMPSSSAPKAPKMKRRKKRSDYAKYLYRIKSLGFGRIVIINRENFELLESSQTLLDTKQKWKERIDQQSALNGRQKLVVLRWFRMHLLKKSAFKFQSNWAFPPYILNIITLHYLENVDDKQQLLDDWSDNYKPCFYFFQQKWNILLRESKPKETYQYLVCLNKKECLIAKQFNKVWIIAKVRIMSKKDMGAKYKWMSYKFYSAPQAFNEICFNVFDAMEEAKI